MPDIEQRIFTGGKNWDDDSRTVPNGDWRDAFCVSIGSNNQQAVNVVEVSYGNSKSSFTPPAGTVKCVGWAPDIYNRSILFCLYSSSGNHQIRRFNIDDNSVDLILEHVLLNFDPSYYVLNAKVVRLNPNNHLFYWVTANNPPRKINIEKASSGGYSAITDQVLDVVKWPPKFAPDVLLINDTNKASNRIRLNQFQFRCRYIYDDRERSRYGPISKWATPDGVDFCGENTFISGDITGNDLYAQNCIEVYFDTGSETVTDIEIAVRLSNVGIWYTLDVLNKQQFGYGNNVIETYRFYNDKTLKAISVADSSEPFDSVPIIANSQELVQENIIVYGGITEGFDNTEIKIDLTPNFVDVSSSMGETDILPTPGPPPYPDDTHIYYDSTAAPVRLYVGDTYNSIYKPGTLIPFSGSPYLMTGKDLNNWPVDFVSNMASYVSASGTPVVTGSINIGGLLYHYIEGCPLSGGIFPPLEKHETFKKGAYFTFGIVYEDRANRTQGTNIYQDVVSGTVENIGRVFINPLAVAAPLSTNQSYKVEIDWAIRTLPPDWATHYRIVRTKSNIDKFVQYVVKDGTKVVAAGSPIYIDFDISPLINYSSDNPYGSVGYTFEDGDKLSIIAYNNSGSMTNAIRFTDMPIVSYDSSTKKIRVLADAYALSLETVSLNWAGAIIQIHHYSDNTDNEIFYEIGEDYEVLTSGGGIKYHAGPTTNQDPLNPATSPATGTISRGDVYLYKRYMNNGASGVTFSLESSDFSDYAVSSSDDKGRPSVYNSNAKQVYFGDALRNSDPYYPNTDINGLSTFWSSNRNTVSVQYGAIVAMRYIGFVLNILQPMKKTSVYIGRVQIQNPDGTSQLITTDSFFGSKTPSETPYGCSDPESVVVEGGILYWFDRINGEYLADGSGRPIPISDIKVANEFRDISLLLKTLAPTDVIVIGGYDQANNRVYVGFVPQNVDAATVIAAQYHYFSVDRQRWIGRMPYFRASNVVPYDIGSDCLAHYGDTFISFIEGELWIENDPDPNKAGNFYDQEREPYIVVVVNNQPDKVKIFTSIKTQSDTVWAPSEDADIIVPANGVYTSDMESKLPITKFVPIESGFYSELLKNTQTPNMPSVEYALINGQPLRGYSAVIKLRKNLTGYGRLFGVGVSEVISQP